MPPKNPDPSSPLGNLVPNMDEKALSPREEQIVHLAVEGHTNDSIAHKLGLSLSTVNTYWVRIRMKVQGDSRTAVVARLIREKAEQALRASNVEKEELAQEIGRRQGALLELHAALSLLQLAMDQLRSAVWATDLDLCVSVIANGEIPQFHTNMAWEIGNTIYQVFHTEDRDHPAVNAHLVALTGLAAETRVSVNGDTLLISVKPLKDEDDAVIGCIGVMSSLRGGV